jgi:hypothetical protein
MDDEGEEADCLWVAMAKLCVSILLEDWAWQIDDQVDKEGFLYIFACAYNVIVMTSGTLSSKHQRV